jgi:hypothetical protein
MDRRVRLTPEEVLDLMSPSPCAFTPWLKPIDGYGRRADLQQLESHSSDDLVLVARVIDR